MSAWLEYQQKIAAETAFRMLAGTEPTEDDLNALQQQHEHAWHQQIEDEENGN